MSSLNFLINIVVGFVKFIVTTYTIITLPIYYLVQKPWKTLKLSEMCGANFIKRDKFIKKEKVDGEKDDIYDLPESLNNVEYLEFEDNVPIPQHPLMKCETIIEAIYARSEVYPNEHPAFGNRKILDEEIQCDKNGTPIKIDGKVLRKYRLSNYEWINYSTFLEQIDAVSRGLYAIGFKKYDPVAIYAETGIDFTISMTGSAKASAMIVTVFHTLTDQGLIYALTQTKVKFIFVNFELLDRVQNFIDKCPDLKTIIYFEGPKKQDIPSFNEDIKVYTLEELKQIGRQEENRHLKIEPLSPNELFGIMYTSGTTGIPKGVKITQKQMKEAAMTIGKVVRDVIMTGPEHTYIAYLPQAHVLEFSIESFLYLGGVKIGYASPFTLNESAPGLAKGEICDLQLLRPTIMTTVPLVLDRMQKEIDNKLRRRTPFSKSIFDYLIEYKAKWISKGYKTPIVNKLICTKVQQQFGGRMKYMVVGGAPLAAQLQKRIKCALNITLIQGYGSTEASGGVFCMDFNDLSYGRVGSPLNGVHARIVSWPDGNYSIDDKPNPRGELIVGGEMISSGYLNQDDVTSESFFDIDGVDWFITGDIVEIHSDGTFSIIDRKKDIIKLANGEFIALGKIEAILKSSCYVDNICIVPNSTLNCLVALIVPNLLSIQKLINQISTTKQDNLLIDENKMENIMKEQQDIIRIIYNDIIQIGFQQKLKSIELPSMIYLCNEVWAPDNDLLTAAMKLKRSNIIKYYENNLKQMWKILADNADRIRVKKLIDNPK